MEDLVILVLVAIIVFLILNDRKVSRLEDGMPTTGPSVSTAPVSPAVTRAIIAKVQGELGSSWPLETLYIKNSGDGVHDARFMFFNTDGYYGTQYDVRANVGTDGSVKILSKTETAIEGDAQNPGYVPDAYQSYDVIEKNLDSQLQDALKNATSYQVWNNPRQTVTAPGPVIGSAPPSMV